MGKQVDFDEGRLYFCKVKVREIVRTLEDYSRFLVRTRGSHHQ